MDIDFSLLQNPPTKINATPGIFVSREQKSWLDHWIYLAKKSRVVSAILLAGIVIISFGTFTDALEKIIQFATKHASFSQSSETELTINSIDDLPAGYPQPFTLPNGEQIIAVKIIEHLSNEDDDSASVEDRAFTRARVELAKFVYGVRIDETSKSREVIIPEDITVDIEYETETTSALSNTELPGVTLLSIDRRKLPNTITLVAGISETTVEHATRISDR